MQYFRNTYINEKGISATTAGGLTSHRICAGEMLPDNST